MVFFVKQETAYEMRISDWCSDVCSSDLRDHRFLSLVGVRGCGRDEAQEQAPVGGVLLGVPLHRDQVVVAGKLHGLHEPVVGAGGHDEPVAEPVDALMVVAVHGALSRADEADRKSVVEGTSV